MPKKSEPRSIHSISNVGTANAVMALKAWESADQ